MPDNGFGWGGIRVDRLGGGLVDRLRGGNERRRLRLSILSRMYTHTDTTRTDDIRAGGEDEVDGRLRGGVLQGLVQDLERPLRGVAVRVGRACDFFVLVD